MRQLLIRWEARGKVHGGHRVSIAPGTRAFPAAEPWAAGAGLAAWRTCGNLAENAMNPIFWLAIYFFEMYISVYLLEDLPNFWWSLSKTFHGSMLRWALRMVDDSFRDQIDLLRQEPRGAEV